MSRRPHTARQKRGRKAVHAPSTVPGRGNAPPDPEHGETYRKPLRLVRGGRPHGSITVAILALLIMTVLIVRALHGMR